MTPWAEREGSLSSLDGRILRLGPDCVLCSFRLPTAMPIPLSVVFPADIELLTWAFAGMKAQTPRPSCLLLLRARDSAATAALANGAELIIRTHFHDIAVSTHSAGVANDLSPEERAVMARAVLSSVTAANVAALVDPITILLPALQPMPVPEKGPDFTIAGDSASSCTLSGTDVPNYILFESNAGIRCVRVATARLTFAPKPLMDLELETVWGPDSSRSARAILLGDGRFTVVNVRAGEA